MSATRRGPSSAEPRSPGVLDDHRCQAAALRMAEFLAAERDDGLVVDELEHAAARSSPRRDCPGGHAWPPAANHHDETATIGLTPV